MMFALTPALSRREREEDALAFCIYSLSHRERVRVRASYRMFQLAEHRPHDGVGILHNITIPEANNADAVILKISRARLVIFSRFIFIVLAAIQFHY